ncbi:hypothetical protein [Pararobbsia silviterrae]|uniref:Uncharacterized protein n=1 Tax=Pararobbsia silviterrae TaxID=1792498 RepID=A0A494XCA8_9BURK|nr:hypothetical protein [Pararobbsia silviterrae]RKP46146.1 hypothetical protein D7S86_24795 [Pararobbsia silviterrae]
MTGVKPSTAAGYHPDVTAACESTLLTLLCALGSLKDTLRLVGGLVPRYLTPEMPPDVPAHAGTSDVDVVLNIALIASGDGYTVLAEQLTARGFERHITRTGARSSWQWRRKVSDTTHVLVEFLRDAGDATPGKLVNVDGEGISALPVKFAGVVHEWYREREITGRLLDGRGIATEIVRFADVPAFVILKALALDDRMENKDAGDLIHVLRYAGTLDEVAEQFAQRERSNAHRAAIDAGLAALRRRFGDDEHGEGHEKAGSVAYARFVGAMDDDDRIANQRFAAGLVQALLSRIEERIARHGSQT